MKYTLYAWRSDNEGGLGFCPSDKFTRMTGYDPESGWRAEPSKKIGEFTNTDELTNLLMSFDSEWYTKELAEKSAAEIMEKISEAMIEGLWD